MVRLIDGSYPPPLDFERASLTWVTKDNSYGRWRVIASCCSSHAGRQEQFVLSPKSWRATSMGPESCHCTRHMGFRLLRRATGTSLFVTLMAICQAGIPRTVPYTNGIRE